VRSHAQFETVGEGRAAVSAGIVGAYLPSGKVVTAAGHEAQLVKNSYIRVDEKEKFRHGAWPMVAANRRS
jgi:hypothetical protein